MYTNDDKIPVMLALNLADKAERVGYYSGKSDLLRDETENQISRKKAGFFYGLGILAATALLTYVDTKDSGKKIVISPTSEILLLYSALCFNSAISARNKLRDLADETKRVDELSDAVAKKYDATRSTIDCLVAKPE